MAKPHCTKKAVLRLTTPVCLRVDLDCQNEELRGLRRGRQAERQLALPVCTLLCTDIHGSCKRIGTLILNEETGSEIRKRDPLPANRAVKPETKFFMEGSQV